MGLRPRPNLPRPWASPSKSVYIYIYRERERERERERALQANSGAKYFPLSSTICYFVVIK